MSLRTAIALLAGLAAPAAAQLSPQMTAGIPGAQLVPVYSHAERERLITVHDATFSYGEVVSVTPNSPYARDGSRLSVWKPSFVLGTASGGEIGVNFWGLHNEGHVNVAFTTPAYEIRLLDCRLLSTGPITYKIFRGPGETNNQVAERELRNGHLFVWISPIATETPVSVELWPTPTTAVMGFLGCEIVAVK